MLHELKILPIYFEEVIAGNKTFEVRKNDRPYKVGDEVRLCEWEVDPNDHSDGNYTGRRATRTITYILDDPQYCKDGYVVFGIK